MRFFGFTEDLIHKIKILLKQPMISLMINDETSLPFEQAPVGSGQGDPISAFLFCLSIQPLLLRLAYDPQIKKMTHKYKDCEGNDAEIVGEPVGFATMFICSTTHKILMIYCIYSIL